MDSEAEKIAKSSVDITEEQLAQLQSIIPGVFKEGKVDWKVLKNILGDSVEESAEKYGLNWSGKSKAYQLIREKATGTLIPQSEESKNWDETENIFIEGDNLEVLKLLQKQYRDKIKMIYIDPPYNTGNDFIYKDNFTQGVSDYYEQTGQTKDGVKLTTNPESNGRYHSDWLTMMYPRLFLARNLLKDDGVIFVSIDDNEVANLRLIMDEIFGEENFVASITVVGNPRGRDYGGIARMHDYILVYIKSEQASINNLADPDKKFPFVDERGEFEVRELRNRNIAFNSDNRPNLYYPFYVNPLKEDKNGFFEISLDKKAGWFELFPKESQGYKTVWRWGKPKAASNLNIEIAAKKMNDGGFQIIEKYREKSRMARSVWSGKEDNTEKGTLLVKSLFNSKVFDFPKSLEMIQKIIEMGSGKDDIILDFFAGSGTAAHAVISQNSVDALNRKWIAVQLPESVDEESEAHKAGYKTISDISRERIRRAGEKIQKGDVGFKSFSLSKSQYSEWNILSDQDDEDLFKKQTELFIEQPLVAGYDEKAVIYEILLKEGFNLNSSVEQDKGDLNPWIIVDGDKKLLVTFAKSITKEQVENLNLSPNDVFVCFDSALDDTTKVNIMRSLTLKVI